jgi:hypothetical protein
MPLCIIEKERSALRRVLQPILRPIFIEIGEGFFDKEFTVERFSGWQKDEAPDSRTSKIDPNHHFMLSDQQSHMSWPRDIHTLPHGESRIVIMNLCYILCLYIRKLTSRS